MHFASDGYDVKRHHIIYGLGDISMVEIYSS